MLQTNDNQQLTAKIETSNDNKTNLIDSSGNIVNIGMNSQNQQIIYHQAAATPQRQGYIVQHSASPGNHMVQQAQFITATHQQTTVNNFYNT